MAEWTEYRVRAERYAETSAKVEKWNRRYAKRGISPIELIDTGEQIFQLDPDGSVEAVEWRVVKMRVELPAISDWSIVGTMHPSSNDDEVAIVHRVPGSSADLTPFYSASFRCAHCGYLRRRNDVFIIENVVTGEQKQVGSTCMTDFTGGGTDPHQVMRLAEFAIDIDTALKTPLPKREFGRIMCDPKAAIVSLNTFLAMVRVVTRRDGRWISVKEANTTGGISTAREAWHLLARQSELDALTSDDFLAAKEAIEWGRQTLDIDSPNEYEHNLAAIVAGDFCSYREAGMIGSLYHARERREKAEASRQTVKSGGDHVGKVGDKIETLVHVDSVDTYDGRFGTVWITKMRSVENGSRFIWWASRNALQPGDKITIKGTVKNHTVFRGEKETVLTRCKATMERKAA